MDARTILEEVYVEYLACSVGAVTATELARLSGGQLSHDQITRALAGPAHGARELWAKVKPLVRAAEKEADGQGVLIVDDTILAKPHSDESELVGWHFDHTVNRAVKGINLLTLFWQGANARLPVGYALVRKQAPAPGKRPKPVTDKNTLFRGLARQAKANVLSFRAVLADSWFASEANMELVHRELKRTFIFALKGNRLAVRAEQNRRTSAWTRIDALDLEEDCPCAVWLRGVEFPVAVLRHRHKNVDGSEADVFFVTNELSLSGADLLALYQKRWQVECYHKSLKQNAAAGRAPLWSVSTLANHLWASLCAYARWEALHLKTRLGHFALKAKVRFAAQQAALATFRNLSTA